MQKHPNPENRVVLAGCHHLVIGGYRNSLLHRIVLITPLMSVVSAILMLGVRRGLINLVVIEIMLPPEPLKRLPSKDVNASS